MTTTSFQMRTQIDGTQETISGNKNVQGNNAVVGTSTVTGNSTLTGNLNVNGNSTLGDTAADTTVISGLLTANNNVISGAGVVAPQSYAGTVQAAAFTATNNSINLLGDLGGVGAIVVILPQPTAGASIKFITVADNTNGDTWTLGVTGGATPNPNFAQGSYIQKNLAGAGTIGLVCVAGHGFNELNIISANNGGGGLGSVVTLTGVNEGGTLRWLAKASLCGKGNVSVADASDFA